MSQSETKKPKLSENEKLKSFTTKYAEVWKFMKFAFTGASTSVLEIGVYMLFLEVVFVNLQDVAVNNPILNFIGVENAGYMWSYFLSAIIGYSAAFVMNRKLTFQADSNAAVSTILYIIMVICTIFITTWLGSFLANYQIEYNLTNAFWNIVVKFIVMTIPTLWTYPLSRFVIHRKSK